MQWNGNDSLYMVVCVALCKPLFTYGMMQTLNSGREKNLTLIYLPLVVSESKAAELLNQDGIAGEWLDEGKALICILSSTS